jgi:hypothetical protein
MLLDFYRSQSSKLHSAENTQVKKCLTAGVAVESKVVLGAALDAGDLVLSGKSLQTGGESSRALLALKSENVGSQTGNVGSSHRGTRNGVGTAVEPGGQDGDTGGEDVDDGAVVGERSQSVRAVSGTDGEDSGLGSGRRTGSIGTIVTGGIGEENTGRDGIGGGGVDSGGFATSKRHGANSAIGAAAGLCVVGDVVDTSNDTRVGALNNISKQIWEVNRTVRTEPLASRTLTA